MSLTADNEFFKSRNSWENITEKGVVPRTPRFEDFLYEFVWGRPGSEGVELFLFQSPC